MKLVLLLFAVMLGIGAVALFVWQRAPAVAPCEAKDISADRSPDGKIRADVFEVRCGNSLTTHVALRGASAPLEARGDVFIALGAVPVRVAWTGERELSVQSPHARILAEETRWRDVTVRVRR